MEDMSSFVLKGFGVKCRKIVKEKTYYICNTDKGIKVVKKSLDNSSRITFQHEIKESLYNKGFLYTDRFNLSVQNKPYVTFNDSIYTMTDLYDFKEISFEDNKQVENAVATVAKMHRSSEDIKYSCEPFYNDEDTVSVFKKSMLDFKATKKTIKGQKRLSDFDVIFLKNYEFYIDQISNSIALLEKTKLDYYNKRSVERNIICHNLLKEENILLDGESVYIITFSQACIDYYLFDLVKLIGRYIKNMVSTPQSLKGALPISEILNIYGKINPLTNEEIHILYALLSYPGKYLKLCEQCYSKKRSFIPGAIVNRLEEIINNQLMTKWYINCLGKELSTS